MLDPEDMSCACSRRRYELETIAKRIDVTLHCKANGDFEPLQCDSGLCWCADEKTGMIQEDTVGVPEDLWTMLPCCELATDFYQCFMILLNNIPFRQLYIIRWPIFATM